MAAPSPSTFRNDAPAWRWGFITLWTLVVCGFAVGYFAGGAVPLSQRLGEVAVVVVMLCGGIAGMVGAFRLPRTRFDFRDGHVVISEFWAIGRRETVVAAADLRVALGEKSKGRRTASRFQVAALLPSGRQVLVCEGVSRDRAEAIRDAVVERLNHPG